MIATFAPIKTADRPAQHHPRIDDFVDRLSRPAVVKTISPFSTFFQVILSFGLLPLFFWPARWAEFLDNERRDFLDLIAWWERRADTENVADLQRIGRRLRRRPILMLFPWLVAAFNVVVIGILFTQGDTPGRIADLTFKYATLHQSYLSYTRPMLPLELNLHSMWMVSLCLAYACHWYAIRSHAVAVHSLVGWTNEVARQSHLSKIKNDALKIGLGPLGIIFGIVLCSAQIWWAIPMIFAGSLQRRYSTQSSPAIRMALAGQTREAFAITRSGPDGFCKSENCGTRLPAQARFCSRCGQAV